MWLSTGWRLIVVEVVEQRVADGVCFYLSGVMNLRQDEEKTGALYETCRRLVANEGCVWSVM